METFNAEKLGFETSEDDAYIIDVVNELRNDKDVYNYIKELGLTVKEVKDNAMKLKDFQDDFNYCKNCPGLKNCNKECPHLRMSLSKLGSYIKVDRQPCEKIVEQLAQESKFILKDYPENFMDARIESLDIAGAGRQAALRIFNQIINKKSTKWLYIQGDRKVGKTYLLATFVNEYLRKNDGSAAFVDCKRRIKEFADLSLKRRDEFDQAFASLTNADILVLDDFGEEYKNEYVRDNVIIPLLSERSHNDKVTFISSSFSIKDIASMYVIKKGGEIRSQQLEKILLNTCEKEIVLVGSNLYR